MLPGEGVRARRRCRRRCSVRLPGPKRFLTLAANRDPGLYFTQVQHECTFPRKRILIAVLDVRNKRLIYSYKWSDGWPPYWGSRLLIRTSADASDRESGTLDARTGPVGKSPADARTQTPGPAVGSRQRFSSKIHHALNINRRGSDHRCCTSRQSTWSEDPQAPNEKQE